LAGGTSKKEESPHWEGKEGKTNKKKPFASSDLIGTRFQLEKKGSEVIAIC